MNIHIQQSWWAMNGLGNGKREWTLEEKFEKLAEAGYSGILGRLPEPSQAELWQRKLEEYGFSFGVHAIPFPKPGDNLVPFLQRAKNFGAMYVNAQVMNQYVVGQPAVQFLQSLLQQAEDVGIPFYLETHRGRITQDLLRTVDYIHSLPSLRLSLDLSHYVVGAAMDEGVADEETEACFQQLLARTSSIHARVSNGHQIQIDIGENGEHPSAARFVRWWAEGMRQWRMTASPNDAFPFVCELGPPSYATVVRHSEFSDRWQQALILKRLGEQAWRM